MANNNARNKAIAKYNKEHYKRIFLNIRKPEYEQIESVIKECKMSANSFILEAVREKIAYLTDNPDLIKQIQDMNIQIEQSKQNKKMEKIYQLMIDNEISEKDVMKLLKLVKQIKELPEID